VTLENARLAAWTTYARELGVNLLQARIEKNISQEKLAYQAGISAFTYQKYEKGQSKPGTPMNPRLVTIVALSQALDVPLWDLLPDGVPDMTIGR
jgi:transcriptional regulator with XRE-family HTH domain